jgi:hypothetical protein
MLRWLALTLMLIASSLHASPQSFVKPAPGSRRFATFLMNAGSQDMRVNGSVTAVDFRMEADASFDLLVESIKCRGADGSIKFGQFLGITSVLTNGLLFTSKSNSITATLPGIKTTEDFRDIFTAAPNIFRLDFQAPTDFMLAVARFDRPLIIRKAGTFVTDDYVEMRVRDNLSAGLVSLECLATGLKEVAP